MTKRHNQIDLKNAQRPDPQYRFRGSISPEAAEQSGIRAEVVATKEDNTAVLRIYDVLDSWGGFWGISASEVLSALDELGDVDTIQVRINSPGGEATEGVAIYNALVQHSARVEVFVDSLAASAASVVAMAGDEITMMTGSQLMIHDAWLICMGDAAEMQKAADLLEHLSDNLASVYAECAGGSTKHWRDAMRDETWYSPDEAVEAGLATKVAKKRKKASEDAAARFDLSVFNFAGRDKAPAPALDTKIQNARASVRASSKQNQENNRMTPEQLDEIGLAEDATDEQISARLAELVKNETTAPDGDSDPNPDDTDASDDENEGGDESSPDGGTGEDETANASFKVPEGAVLVDKAQHQGMQARLAKLEKDATGRAAAEARAERDRVMVAAMKDGKFPPAQRKHYESFWDADPKAAKALIDELAPNTVAVLPVGFGADAEGVQDDAFPRSMLRGADKKKVEAGR